MLKITVEGIYESDTGSGQKQYEPFNYDFTISRPNAKGIETHVQKRFVPYFIAHDKKKIGKVFSRLRTCIITNVENIDDKNSVIGKDIAELNDLEIQDLASLFDLYEVPLPMTSSISEMREKATLAYMKKVLKIPMKTPKEKAQCSFLKVSPDGTYKLDLKGEKCLVKVPVGYFEKVQKAVEKKSLSFFEKIVNAVNGSQNISENTNDDDGFPSANELLNDSSNSTVA